MPQINAAFVKQGFWVNNPEGSIMGQTITTDTSTGAVIVALTAVLTTFGIGGLWNLAVFVYHQIRTNNKPTNGFYRQQQVLLRTQAPPNTMLTEWLKLWWSWKGRVDRPFRRSLFLLILASFFFSASVVVGVFSSYLIDSDDIIVLVSSSYCDAVDYLQLDTSEDSWHAWYQAYAGAVAEEADRYTRDCYGNRATTPERCKIYVQPTIPSRQKRSPCPFEQCMCKNISQPGLTIDTDLLDLNNHFGLNLATQDRMRFRYKSTCAIIETKGHYDVITSTNSTGTRFEKGYSGLGLYSEEQIRRFYFGKTSSGNWTMAVSSMPVDQSRRMEAAPQYYYHSPSWVNQSSFSPIPELKSNESDLFLAFVMMHSVSYLEPVEDPLFSAHRRLYELLTSNSTRTRYIADEPVAVFGCQTQYKFCFAQGNKGENCTPLQGLSSTQPSLGFPTTTAVQLAVFKLILALLKLHDSSTTLSFFQPAGLGLGTNAPLPSDQWVQQFALLVNTVLTQIQIGLSAHATGPSTLTLGEPTPMQRHTTAAERSLCGLQRMRSPGGFVNIPVFPLVFVITLCIFLIILDVILLKFLIFWGILKKLLAPRINAWIEDSIFQVQRSAYEAQGEGSWECSTTDIPVTTRDIELTVLQLHPRSRCNCGMVGMQSQSQLSTPQTAISHQASQENPGTTTQRARPIGTTLGGKSISTSPQSRPCLATTGSGSPVAPSAFSAAPSASAVSTPQDTSAPIALSQGGTNT